MGFISGQRFVKNLLQFHRALREVQGIYRACRSTYWAISG